MMSLRMLRWAASRSTDNGYSKLMLSAPLIGFIAVRDRYAQEQCLQAGRIWQRAHLFATARGFAARPVTRSWKWWTMSGHWADRPRAGLLNEITADPTWQPTFVFYMGIQSCRPTPAHAVLFKRYSSDGPDPASAPRAGRSLGNSVHRGCNLAADRGRIARLWLSISKQGRVPFKKGSAATTGQGGSYFPQARFWTASAR
jgi:hypothetical protein